MHRTLIALFVTWFLVGLASTAKAQDPPVLADPLMRIINEVVTEAWTTGSKAIEPHMRPDDDPRIESSRVANIKRFAEGFKITRQNGINPKSPWSEISITSFKITRPHDEHGKLLDEVWVRLDIPFGIYVTSHLDNKRYRQIKWVIKFVKDKIESVTQEFLVPATWPGRIPLQWVYASKRLFT